MREIKLIAAFLLFVVLACIAEKAFAQSTCTVGTCSNRLNITAATVVKPVPGALVSFTVVVAGSAAGSINDTTTTGAAAASNQIAVTPASVGTFYAPFAALNGIVVVPGTGQTIAVTYQ